MSAAANVVPEPGPVIRPRKKEAEYVDPLKYWVFISCSPSFTTRLCSVVSHFRLPSLSRHCTWNTPPARMPSEAPVRAVSAEQTLSVPNDFALTIITSQGKRIRAVVAVFSGMVTVLLTLLNVLSEPKSSTATVLLLRVTL